MVEAEEKGLETLLLHYPDVYVAALAHTSSTRECIWGSCGGI